MSSRATLETAFASFPVPSSRGPFAMPPFSMSTPDLAPHSGRIFDWRICWAKTTESGLTSGPFWESRWRCESLAEPRDTSSSGTANAFRVRHSTLNSQLSSTPPSPRPKRSPSAHQPTLPDSKTSCAEAPQWLSGLRPMFSVVASCDHYRGRSNLN